jgi:DNA-binding transcriptional LysR family regulator
MKICFRLIMETDQWLGVEVRHLAALQAVAEERSFGRAATRLGYTQSAVSQQIATLEKTVGTRLVERPGGPRPVSLTEAGDVLLRHAGGIVAQLRAAQADLAALAEGSAGTLRVGTYQSAGARILPDVISRFKQAYPDVSVALREGEDDDLAALVEEGELDLCFIAMPPPEGPFEGVELLQDPYVLIVQAGSPLARRDRAPALREIAELPLISFRTCRAMHQIETHLRARGHDADVVFRSDDNGTVQGMVAAGFGVALLPMLAVDQRDDRVAIVDLQGKVPPRIVGVTWHRDRRWTPAAETFVRIAQEVCREVQATLPGGAAVEAASA